MSSFEREGAVDSECAVRSKKQLEIYETLRREVRTEVVCLGVIRIEIGYSPLSSS